MVRILSAAAAVAGFSAAAAAETIAITMAVPPSGSAGPITGTISGVDGMTYSNYKIMIATSADNGATWWDKSHSPYFLHYQRDPGYDAGNLQNAAVVLQSDWSFTLQGYAASPYDATSDLWVAMLVPSSYDMKWPEYQIEGVQMPVNPPAIALAYVEVSKSRGRVAGGPGGCACGGPGVPNPALGNNPATGGGTAPAASASPAASTSAAPAASHSAAASPSSAAAAPSSAAAASPSSAPAAASPSSAAASPAGTGNGNGNNALPGTSPDASPAPGSSSLPAASNGAPAPGGSTAPVTSGAQRSGLPAALAAGAAAVAAALFMAQ